MRFISFLTLATLFAACTTGNSQEAMTPPGTAAGTEPSPMLVAGSSPVERKKSYSEVNVPGRYLALTFDDGPHETLTPKLLDMLKKENAHCTFFVVGQNAAEYPAILKRAVAEGHEIANHSWSHPSLSKLSVSGIESQLDRTDAAIEKGVGRRTKLVRPPYGATNATVRKVIADRGEIVVLWSVDPLDWKYRNADRVARELIQGAAPGGILLAHDIHPSTVASVPEVLSKLTAQGYKFVTVSELLAMETSPAPVPEPSPAAAATATPAVNAVGTGTSAVPAASAIPLDPAPAP